MAGIKQPSVKKLVWGLFEKGLLPGDPEIKNLKIKYHTIVGYYSEFMRQVNENTRAAETPLTVDEIGDGSGTDALVGKLDEILRVKNEMKGELKNEGPAKEKKVQPEAARAVATAKPIIVKDVESAKDASYVNIIPKAFTMPATIIWMAMDVAIRYWGWPADMTPEQFLDTYLKRSFKQRGATIGGYIIEDGARHDHWRGNGHHDNDDGEELVENVIGGIENEPSQ